MSKYYTAEKNAQVVIALLKAHGIRKVIASPGTTNVALIGSMQHDPFFELFSSVDERSAAYMACGLAAESCEPVVISCTGATASRNYLPGLTEAYYRKLPVLAVTSTQMLSRVGQHVAQIIDRSSAPKDAVKLSVHLPIVKDADDLWECEIKVNQAILELTRHGGGPVHINLPTVYDKAFTVQELPQVRAIRRITPATTFPELNGRVAVLVGNHKRFSTHEAEALDRFCERNDAVVFCDHTSGYKGKYRVQTALIGSQSMSNAWSQLRPDIMIHIGEITGDYATLRLAGKAVWRVSEDGEIRDTFRRLRYVFEMPETAFFEHYSNAAADGIRTAYLDACRSQLQQLREKIPEVPLSNIWLASKLAHRIPGGSTIHFGILNSLRAWNLYELPNTVAGASNTGGFGIDGGLSSLIGASLADPKKLFFGVIGDLAFFYDMNSIGNRHVGKNLRILLVNNGKGTEFRNYNHHAARFGEDSDKFFAAAGHFGNKSPTLVKSYAESLGFEYFAASSKEEFLKLCGRFVTPELTDKPILVEVFTDSDDESKALELMNTVEIDAKARAKQVAKRLVGESSVDVLKKILR